MNNIIAACYRSGLWILDATRIISQTKPHNVKDIDNLLESKQLIEMYEEKRAKSKPEILYGEVEIM